MDTTVVRRLADVPAKPGVYVMYGGSGHSLHPAYVGIGKELRGRLRQHLVLRDSSVVTGTSAAGLNIDHVREIEWYLHDRFTDRIALDAAERVAEEHFRPAFRSRGRTPDESLRLSDDPSFAPIANAHLLSIARTRTHARRRTSATVPTPRDGYDRPGTVAGVSHRS